MEGYLTCAETAKLIRKAIKREFPGVKFSVRSKTYSGGASIRVDWIDGPRQKAVEAVAGAFAGGRFDGMIDLAYSVEHWLLPDGTVTIAHNPGSGGSMGCDPGTPKQPKPHPEAVRVHLGAKYVFCDRDYSPEYRARVESAIAEHYGRPYGANERYGDDWGSSVVWKFAEGQHPFEDCTVSAA